MGKPSSGKKRAATKHVAHSERPGRRRMPSRLVKRHLVDRLKQDTQAMESGNLADRYRKLGFEELPLDELQDRLSKLQAPLAEAILKGRA